jgi:pteridine reductase
LGEARVIFNHKLALITGSTSEIGKKIALKLASDGWKIALHYNSSEKKAYELAKELLPLVDVMVFKADLSVAEQVQKMSHKISREMGEISLIINNASLFKNDNILNLDPINLQESLNLHLSCPIYLAKEMKNGDIINIIDTNITQNIKKFFSYSLSQKSLFELSRMMAFNLAPNIKVNAIAPGPIIFKEGQNKELFDSLVSESPLQNKATIDDLYNAIMFFVNTKSVTGECMFLDGGRHLL